MKFVLVAGDNNENYCCSKVEPVKNSSSVFYLNFGRVRKIVSLRKQAKVSSQKVK
jgi:hypothetical protein